MSKPFIVPRKNKREHNEKLQKKACGFPGCKDLFMGTGKSKYCLEHRKRKYRKIIDADKINDLKIEEESNNSNQVIKHNFTETTKVFFNCHLKDCRKEFEVNIYPHIFVYPKYCPEHRNTFKREMWINERKN